MEKSTASSVQITKEFPAPVDTLYKAWVEEEALKQWWSPIGHQLKEVKNDLKKGGTVEYRFSNEKEDPSLIISGTYEEVAEKERLVYSWNWQLPHDPVRNNAFKLTISFKGQGEGSRLDVKQENLEDDEAIQVHKEGWEKALEQLHSYLSSAQSQKNGS